jgi:uncharacterized protein (DUF58 family)
MRRPGLSLRQRWRQYTAAWWDARLPRKDHLTLTQRNLYILPTRAGWSLAAVFIVLLLASINEQLNLGYALSFTLGGAALAALHQTHGNLQGVSLRLLGLRSVHAGQVLRVSLILSHTHARRGRFGLQVHAGEQDPVDVELPPASDSPVELDVPTPQRGWLYLPRLTIDSRYPLGIFRAWAYWRPASKVLIWPALETQAPPLPFDLGTPEALASAHLAAQSGDTPEGLRDYRRGDPFKWIAWKKSSHALASGTGLVSREPATSRSPDRWLDFDSSPGLAHLGTEARLSRLASWLCEAEAQAASPTPGSSGSQGALYGLRLPGTVLPCGSGAPHLRQCLDALALWGQAP